MGTLFCSIRNCEGDARLIYYGLSLCMECWTSWEMYSRGKDSPRTTEIVERYIEQALNTWLKENAALVEAGEI